MKEAKEQERERLKIQASEEYQKKLKRNEEVEKLANTNFGQFSPEQLKSFLGRLKQAPSVNENLDQKIKDRISKVGLLIPVQEQKQELKEMYGEKEELQKELDDLSWKKHQKEMEIRGMEAMTLMELDADKTSVYLERDLSEKEVNLLLQHDFKRAVEYCVDEQRFVKVLVKRTMNHSITHTFLVWSVLKFLKRVPGITNLETWDTREADITFNHERFYRRDIAIEIETGNILNKKGKLQAKVDDLNKKYKNRWIFLVSKKSLLGKYRKFGPAVCRSDFQKAMKNLLKPASPFEGI